MFYKVLAGEGTCSLAQGQAKADGGVAEGHDSGQDGQEPQPVKVWNLAQQQLEGAKDDHEGIVVHLQCCTANSRKVQVSTRLEGVQKSWPSAIAARY